MESRHCIGSDRGTAPPLSVEPDPRACAVAVTGYRRLGVDGWPTRVSAVAERWRLGTWTQRRGWKLASIVEEQASRHGTRAEGLADVVARVASSDSDGLVVPNLAHLAPSPPEALLVIELILAAGGVFASIDERLDPSTVSGRRRYLCLCGFCSCGKRDESGAGSEPDSRPDAFLRRRATAWMPVGLSSTAGVSAG